jgi:multiple sugar transport system substrate-binding protein
MPGVKEARQRPTTMPNALTFDAVYDYGINDPHFVLGPKVPRANEYHTIVATETQRCISGETMPEEACQNIKNQVDALH